jgi:hypothetical protein
VARSRESREQRGKEKGKERTTPPSRPRVGRRKKGGENKLKAKLYSRKKMELFLGTGAAPLRYEEKEKAGKREREREREKGRERERE